LREFAQLVQHGRCMGSKKNPKPERPQVGAGLIIRKGNSILLGFREKKFGYGQLCLPGGHVELFETAEVAAIREAEEECGLKVGKAKLIGFTEDFYPEDGKHYITIFFTARWIGGEPVDMEPNKISNWQWYPIKDLKHMKSKLWEPCIEKFRKLGWL
jgi:8-oxo-dGTP diphosphatase